MYVNRVDLKNDDIILATFRSDTMNQKTLEAVKDQLKTAFPENRVATIGITSDDKIDFLVVGGTATSQSIELPKHLTEEDQIHLATTRLVKNGYRLQVDGTILPPPKLIKNMNKDERNNLFEANIEKLKNGTVPATEAIPMPSAKEEEDLYLKAALRQDAATKQEIKKIQSLVSEMDIPVESKLRVLSQLNCEVQKK